MAIMGEETAVIHIVTVIVVGSCSAYPIVIEVYIYISVVVLLAYCNIKSSSSSR